MEPDDSNDKCENPGPFEGGKLMAARRRAAIPFGRKVELQKLAADVSALFLNGTQEHERDLVMSMVHDLIRDRC